ncbi:MAG: hypothetical protein ACRDQ1_04590 [Sciscionella sp.]
MRTHHAPSAGPRLFLAAQGGEASAALRLRSARTPVHNIRRNKSSVHNIRRNESSLSSPE